MMNERSLIELGIKMRWNIESLKDSYPELKNDISIKKLVSISSEWDKIFSQISSSSREGGK